MNRRTLLGASVAGFALTTAPRWLRAAFASEPSSRSLVFDAYRRARRAHRALLVFVIPVDGDAQWLRGTAIGAFLTYATDAQLAPLSRCEVACATMAHVRTLVPDAPTGEPFAVMIDTTAVPARVGTIGVGLVDPQTAGSDLQEWDLRMAAANHAVMANLAELARALRAGLGSADPALAAQVRARLSDHDVPGSRWAHAGCVTTFEHPEKGDEDPASVGCGMAFVPEKSRRFLYLLATADS